LVTSGENKGIDWKKTLRKEQCTGGGEKDNDLDKQLQHVDQTHCGMANQNYKRTNDRGHWRNYIHMVWPILGSRMADELK